MHPPLDDIAELRTPLPRWFREAFEVPRGEGTVDIDGHPIKYLEWGDRSRPPVLMTHGFLAHSRVFAFVAPFLAEQFHLVAFDLSGMGDSGWRPAYGDRTDEAMAVAEAAGLFEHARRPIFVTHSFGGTVAIDTTIAHPDRFSGLVVCDLMMMPRATLTAYLPDDPIAKMPPARATSNKVYPDLETALQRYRLAPPQPCDNDFLLEYMARTSLKPFEGGWTWKFDPNILRNPRNIDWWASVPVRFAESPVPKAIIHGRDSLLFPKASVEYMRTLVGPAMPIIGIPGAHHHLMLDQPIAFITALETLLSTLIAFD